MSALKAGEFHVSYPVLPQPSLLPTLSLPLPGGDGEEPPAGLPREVAWDRQAALGRVEHNGSGLEEEAAAFPFVRLHWGRQRGANAPNGQG